MTLSRPIAAALLCAGLATLTASCDKDKDNNNTVTPADTGFVPKGPRPEWGPTMTDSMLVVIEAFQSFGAPPIETLTPQQARQQPTFADAVKKAMAEHNIAMPPPQVDTSGIEIPVAGGTVHARVYRPKSASGQTPGILYYHGGGFVIANIDVYDASARGIAEQTGATVVSVGYRKGPEFKFPTAHNDAFAAYKWVAMNGGSISINPAKLAVIGESAGGNLACNVAIMARDSGVTMPKHQVLVYPVANNDLNSNSALQYKDAKPLNRAMLPWFLMYYLNDMSESNDPRIKLVSANFAGLPPATIINAEIDPLRDDGEALRSAMQAAGVTATRKLYSGVTHEFFGAAIVIPEAKDAQAVAAAALRAALQ